MEKWLDIRGYEGYYQVSSLGRVQSIQRVVEYKGGGPRKRSQRILKSHAGSDGYHNVRLSKGGIVKNHRVSRLVAQAFVANPNGYPIVNHLNADFLDNRPENLQWCTIKQNNQYTHLMGRATKTIGSNSHLSRIDENKARAIKLLTKAGMERPNIAKALGTSRAIVRGVQNGNTWKHVLI